MKTWSPNSMVSGCLTTTPGPTCNPWPHRRHMARKRMRRSCDSKAPSAWRYSEKSASSSAGEWVRFRWAAYSHSHAGSGRTSAWPKTAATVRGLSESASGDIGCLHDPFCDASYRIGRDAGVHGKGKNAADHRFGHREAALLVTQETIGLLKVERN